MQEIRIDHSALGFSIVYFLEKSSSALKSVKFEASGDYHGESIVIALMRQSANPKKRKKVMRVEGDSLVLGYKDSSHPITLRVPQQVSSRALKLLIQGREQYRALKVSTKISWAKELTLSLPQ